MLIYISLRFGGSPIYFIYSWTSPIYFSLGSNGSELTENSTQESKVYYL